MDQTFDKIKNLLVQALNADEDDVTPDSRVVGDLGAESIDFLDITFRVERAFDIRIQKGELFPEGVFDGDPECMDADGKVTAHGLDKLQAAMPHVALKNGDGSLTFDGTLSGLADAFTVQSLVNFVNTKLKAQS